MMKFPFDTPAATVALFGVKLAEALADPTGEEAARQLAAKLEERAAAGPANLPGGGAEMIRDEARNACLDAMTTAIAKRYAGTEAHMATFEDSVREDSRAAFDALNGIARVNTPKATERMQLAAFNAIDWTTKPFGWDLQKMLDDGIKAGDLTNGPEKKT